MAEPSTASPQGTGVRGVLRRPTVRRLLELVGVVLVLGLLTGIAWYLIAPTPSYIVRADGIGFTQGLPGAFVAADGWFAVCGTVAGIVLAIIVLRRGMPGPSLLVAVAFLGLLGSVIAWRVGHFLGPDAPDFTVKEPVGTVLHGQLKLVAKGVLLIWPVVTLAIVTFALAWTSRDEKHRQPSQDDSAPALVGRDGDLPDLDRG